MGGLEKLEGGVARRRPTTATAGHPSAVVGTPIAYQDVDYTANEAWAMLSPQMQFWAHDHAGDPIRDPHTGRVERYWYCRVDVDEPMSTSGSGVRSAAYSLLIFGRRGLVVSTGTTEHFVPEPGGTKWRNSRFDVPVDPSQIRHDHRRAAPQAAGDASPAQVASPPGGILTPKFEAEFGNLPAATQVFLLQPFTASGQRPVEMGLHATTTASGREYQETFWTYLFNARWMAFSYSVRSVPYQSRLSGTALWNDSPEARSIRGAPWRVSAWVAPKFRPGNDMIGR